jgi:hypothetical protein
MKLFRLCWLNDRTPSWPNPAYILVEETKVIATYTLEEIEAIAEKEILCRMEPTPPRNEMSVGTKGDEWIRYLKSIC